MSAILTSYGSGMATSTTAPPRAHRPERLLATLVVVSAIVGIVVAAVPSVLRLVKPPEPWFCPAIWPPHTSCVPGAHLVVVGVAVVGVTFAWLATDVTLRRVRTVPARAGVVAGLAVIALLAWSAARVPQPYFAAWSGLFG